MKKSDASDDQPASELISKKIATLGDWRGDTRRDSTFAASGGRRPFAGQHPDG